MLEFNKEKDTILRYHETVLIPKETGIRVIGASAFKGSKIKKIIIPEGIEVIQKKAFQGCRQLEEVVLPESLRIIEDNAFDECESLKEIIFPRKLSKIGKFSFAHCSGLKVVKISKFISSIPAGAFAHCTNLKRIKLPNSLSSIGASAFERTYDLKKINFPNSLRSIGASAFEESGLEELPFQEGLISIGERAFAKLFSECNRLKKPFTLPESLKSIGERAFEDFPFLIDNLTIPKGIESIQPYTFHGAILLYGPVVVSQGLTAIETRAFENCVSLRSVTLPESLEKIASAAFKGCKNLFELKATSLSNVTEVGFEAFQYCTLLHGSAFQKLQAIKEEMDSRNFASIIDLIVEAVDPDYIPDRPTS